MGSSNPCGARQSWNRTPAASQHQTSTNLLGLNPPEPLPQGMCRASLELLERQGQTWCPQLLGHRTPRAWAQPPPTLAALGQRSNPCLFPGSIHRHGQGCRHGMVGKATCPQL